MGYLLSVDVGGTFTDIVLFDYKTGRMKSFKSPTTPKNTANGVFNAIDLVAEDHDVSRKELLNECDRFVYGCTTATNAIVSNQQAKTGLIVTYGFEDVLYFREGGKESAYDFSKEYPPPYIPRELTKGLRERINSEGDILIPLNEDEVKKVVRELVEEGVEAIAVCTLWSITNPKHEKKIGSIIEKEYPSVSFTLSHELNPIIREYRRASSTAIDASLKPIVSEHVSNFCSKLRNEGYGKDKTIWFLSSSAGLLPSEEVIEMPIYLVNSGPSMCPKAGLSFAEMEFIENGQDLLVVDTGGTTFDVSMVRNGRIAQTHEMWLKEKYTGHILGIPSVDVKSIGAGGGSIAWLDDSGMVHVGPKSAGADPGPACYGLGGTDPTVTDAAVVLGYINPDYFVGGKMKIYPELARKAISENIAQPLGLSEEKTAAGIMEVLNTDSIGAIEDISVKQGFNPRKSMIVTGGGAAPLHIIDVAKKLGIKEVLIPDLSSVLSATGSVFSNIVSEFAISYFAESNRVNYEKLDEVLSELQYRAENFLKKSGVKSDHRLIEYSVEARYPYQVWEIEVPLTKKEIRNEKDVKQIVNNFHKVHQNRFGVAEPEQYIEMITWKARAIGEIKKPKIKREEKSDNDISLALKNESRAYFNDYSDFVKVPRYDGGLLKYGHQIDGPAIIERPKTTVVVYPNSKIKVTPYGNYLAEIQTGD